MRVSDAGECRQEVLKEEDKYSNDVVRDHFVDGLSDVVLRKVIEGHDL